jgi:hypothetical protein
MLPSSIPILIFESAPFHDEKVGQRRAGRTVADYVSPCMEPGAALLAKWGPESPHENPPQSEADPPPAGWFGPCRPTARKT